MSSEFERALIEAAKAATRLMRAHAVWRESLNRANGAV